VFDGLDFDLELGFEIWNFWVVNSVYGFDGFVSKILNL
jgi:hypothetical protein